MELKDLDFNKTLAIYKKFFSVHFLNSNLGDKLAVIALTCYITNELRKKDKEITCYDVLLKVGKDFGKEEKETFLKSLGAICEDLFDQFVPIQSILLPESSSSVLIAASTASRRSLAAVVTCFPLAGFGVTQTANNSFKPSPLRGVGKGR